MTTERRLRVLEIYAGVSLMVFLALAVTGFTSTTKKFTEIDVERLNVREKNGQLVMVAANSTSLPDPIVNGRSFKAERPAGMLFFNGHGDENGGLVFGAVTAENYYGAYQGLTFDKFKQAQAMALIYNDKSGKYRAGLQVWDRPELPLDQVFDRRDKIAKMPEGEAKNAAIAQLKKEEFSATRIYVGKNADRDSEVTLYDGLGKARIKMLVTADGNPKLEFLDAQGATIYSLPADALKGK